MWFGHELADDEWCKWCAAAAREGEGGRRSTPGVDRVANLTLSDPHTGPALAREGQHRRILPQVPPASRPAVSANEFACAGISTNLG